MQGDAAIEMMPRHKSRRAADIETDYQPVNWKRLFLTPKYLACWVVLIIAIVLTVILTIRHEQVVAYLRPWSEKVRDLPAGWLIPIAILIIISFPPLFGHELIALLCGVVYGLWVGFGIVAAGTFLGELGTWFAFKYLFRRKAEKLERTNLNYGALARLTRDGGFWIILLIRSSAIPSHFSTAVFSTCDVNFFAFALATLLTLPKQIFLVYLGVLLLQDQPDRSAKNIVFGVAFAVTIVMAVYIWYKMRQIKRVLLAEQAERRKRGLGGGGGGGGGGVGNGDGGEDEGADSEGRGLLLVGGSGGVGDTRERDFEAIGREEADIGVVGRNDGRDLVAGETQGPRYREDFEYQGLGGSGQVGKGAVREQAWV